MYSANGSLIAGRVLGQLKFSSVMSCSYDEEIKQAEYVSYSKC